MYKKYAELRDKAGVTDYEVSKQTGIATSTLAFPSGHRTFDWN